MFEGAPTSVESDGKSDLEAKQEFKQTEIKRLQDEINKELEDLKAFNPEADDMQKMAYKGTVERIETAIKSFKDMLSF